MNATLRHHHRGRDPIEDDQALMARLAESLARGTPARGKIAPTIASDVVREIV